MRRPIKKKDDDRRGKKDCSWFVAIEKHAVLTEVRSFGDPHFDKTRCLPIIRKLLYLLNQGETFTKSEAAAVLSCAIKLYRFQDIYLRRMFYLIAKELCPVADEVPLVTSSLLKDLNSCTAVYRANAVRLLCQIRKSSTRIGVYLEEAIRDENPMVQSAALVSAINLIKKDPWIVKILLTIGFENAIWTRAKHEQFHVLYLLFRIQGDDMLSVEALVSRYTELINDLGIPYFSSSPLGLCLIARGVSQVTRVKHISAVDYPGYYEYLKSCIYHKDEMVAIEGFRSVEELRGISISELKPAMDVMRRLFRASRKPVVRFAAFKALQKVGVAHRVVWKSRQDYIAIGLDVNVKKLYLEADEVNHHRDKEGGVEVTQVVKSQSFQMKEASTHNLRRRRLGCNHHLHKSVIN